MKYYTKFAHLKGYNFPIHIFLNRGGKDNEKKVISVLMIIAFIITSMPSLALTPAAVATFIVESPMQTVKNMVPG